MEPHEPIREAHTFWDLIERRAAATPDHPFLFDAADRRFTFKEIRDWAERVAAGLAALGVGEGTPVTWQLPTRIETVVASFALSRLGAVQNPIIHIYRDKEVGFCIRQTKAQLVLTMGEWRGFDYAAMVERVTADLDRPPKILIAYDTLPEGDPATLVAPPGAVASVHDDPVRWIYYTSGTTSDPKGAMHSDLGLLAGGIGLARALDMSATDVGSIAFPYAHIGGPDYMVTMLSCGFPAVLMETFVPVEAVGIYRRLGVTMAGGGTAFYTMILAEQRKNPGAKVIPSLRLLSGGGAPMPPEVFFEVQREVGIPVAHGYGMTECPMISQGSPRDTDEQLSTSEGHPVNGCAVTIVCDDGSVAPVGVVGEVRVSGPMVFKGYVDPVLNANAFDDAGRFRTGDLGLVRPDGHVRLTGRLKDVIIRKGENISAQEVEDVLYAHPKVANVAVIGLPDAERGERVCAVVETAAGVDPLTFPEMQAWCRGAGLMNQKIPEQLELRETLPRNATLKVLKHQLRAELASAKS
jgi:cyclohexanecarboxylate-CoA ligase